jgi:MFS family permease
MTVVAMGLGNALALGDLGILSANVSIVRRALQFSSSTTSFVAVVATLAMAAAALGAGVLGDVYGMKRMLLAGAGGAMGFGLLAAAAPNVAVLIIARAGSGHKARKATTAAGRSSVPVWIASWPTSGV